MIRLYKIIAITIGIIIVAGIGFGIYVFNKLEKLETGSNHKFEKIILVNQDKTEALYLRASVWGLNGDHIQILLSSTPLEGKAYDSTLHYVFYTPTIFYKQLKDTLTIYTPTLSKNVPSKFNHNVTINQIIINDENEFEKSLQKDSLGDIKQISVY